MNKTKKGQPMYTDYSQLLSAIDEIQNFDNILHNENFGVVYNREQDTFWYTDTNEIYQIDLIALFSPYNENILPPDDITTLFQCDWSGVYVDSNGISQYVWFRKRNTQNLPTQ